MPPYIVPKVVIALVFVYVTSCWLYKANKKSHIYENFI